MSKTNYSPNAEDPQITQIHIEGVSRNQGGAIHEIPRKDTKGNSSMLLATPERMASARR